MKEILGEGHRIQEIQPPETLDFTDEAYSTAVLKEFGENQDVESIRQGSLERDIYDLSEATAMNLKQGASTENTIPIYLRAIAYLEQYNKDKKSYEIANEYASEKSFEQYLDNNPQAILNYANSGEIDFKSIQDSRILNLQYELSKTIDTDAFTFDLITRIGTDYAAGFVGNAMKNSPHPLVKGAGYLLASNGFGQAKDAVLLGGKTIYETGVDLRERYLNIIGADLTDEEYKEEVKNFVEDFKKIPSAYRAEQLDYILSDVSPYADAGGAGLTAGIRIGVSPFKSFSHLKGLSKYFGNKKNTINNALMKEMDDLTTEKVDTSGTSGTSGTSSQTLSSKTETQSDVDYSSILSYEEKLAKIAEDIDARKSKGAVTLYNNNPVQVISTLEDSIAIEPEIIPPSKTTIYRPKEIEADTIIDVTPTPSGLLEKPVINMPHVKPAQLEWKTVVDEYIDTKFEALRRPIKKESDWEHRRINYTDDNRGRGYTLEEAYDAVYQYEADLATTYRRGDRAVLSKKKLKDGYEYEEYEWIDKGYDYDYQPVSAASPVPFNRAASTMSTKDKGASGAYYGQGPYASEEGTGTYGTLEGPASFGHYRTQLELDKFFNSMRMTTFESLKHARDVFDDIVKYFDLDRQNIIKDSRDILYGVYEDVIKDSPLGMVDYYEAFKNFKKEINKWNRDDHRPVVHSHHDKVVNLLSEIYVDHLLDKYKGHKSGIMNYWYGVSPDSQPSHWVDQRSNKRLYEDQVAIVQRSLKKYAENLQKKTKPLLENKQSTLIKNNIFRELFGDDYDQSLTTAYIENIHDVERLNVFSDQYPVFIRLAMDEISDEEWLKFATMDRDSFEYDEAEHVIKRLLSFNGQEMQRKMLIDVGIWGNVHSDTNFVFFKQTPAQMSNVYKQTWTEDGYYYVKLLDSGAFPVYDPKLQAYVVKTSVVVPGKGRKPVMLNKQKIKKMKKRKQ
jgi:hypothetical protein